MMKTVCDGVAVQTAIVEQNKSGNTGAFSQLLYDPSPPTSPGSFSSISSSSSKRGLQSDDDDDEDIRGPIKRHRRASKSAKAIKYVEDEVALAAIPALNLNTDTDDEASANHQVSKRIILKIKFKKAKPAMKASSI